MICQYCGRHAYVNATCYDCTVRTAMVPEEKRRDMVRSDLTKILTNLGRVNDARAVPMREDLERRLSYLNGNKVEASVKPLVGRITIR
jgi:hypothetical protein